MKFTKRKGISLIAVGILLVMYNTIVFVLPFTRTPNFWVGYAFSMIAILLTTGVGLYALGHEGIKSKFYGLPLVLVAWTFLIVQIIVGFVEMLLPSIPVQYPVVLNIVMLCVCLIGLIGTSLGTDEVERIDQKIKDKVFFVKSLQADVEGLISKTPDASLKKSLKDLSETIRYSDPMSKAQLASIENKIDVAVSALSGSLDDGDKAQALCDELQQLFAERNRKCKLLK